MDINQMNLSELKVLAYDVLVNTQKLQNDLNVINQLITKKSNEEPEPEKQPEEPKKDIS